MRVGGSSVCIFLRKNSRRRLPPTKAVLLRLCVRTKPIGLFEGSIGGQFFYKELSVLGGEVFLQPSQTTEIAATRPGFSAGEWGGRSAV